MYQNGKEISQKNDKQNKVWVTINIKKIASKKVSVGVQIVVT